MRDVRRNPLLHRAQEVNPVSNRAPRIILGERRAIRRLDRANTNSATSDSGGDPQSVGNRGGGLSTRAASGGTSKQLAV